MSPDPETPSGAPEGGASRGEDWRAPASSWAGGDEQAPVDLDAGGERAPAVIRTDLAKEPYDPARFTDNARLIIALLLIGALGLIIVGALVIFYSLMSGGASQKDNFDHLVAILNIVFGPVVTLVGSATGFYFGSQSRAGAPKSQP